MNPIDPRHAANVPGTLAESAAALPAGALSQAGIEQRPHVAAHLEIREPAGVTLARLRSLAAHDELAAALADCGLPLPECVNGCAGQDPAVICLGPGDWMLFSESLDFERLSGQLAAAIDSRLTALVDVSSACAVLRITGAAGPWLLQKLCGLDLCGNLSAGPHAARTRLDHAAVILHYHQPGSGAAPFAFDLVFDRSLARYGWELLLAAAPHAEELYSRHGIPA